MSENNSLPYWILVEFQALEKDLAETHHRMRELIAKAMKDVTLTFAGAVRKTAKGFRGTGKSFSSTDIAMIIGCMDAEKRKQIPVALGRMVKKEDGLERVKGMKGRYRWA